MAALTSMSRCYRLATRFFVFIIIFQLIFLSDALHKIKNHKYPKNDPPRNFSSPNLDRSTYGMYNSDSNAINGLNSSGRRGVLKTQLGNELNRRIVTERPATSNVVEELQDMSLVTGNEPNFEVKRQLRIEQIKRNILLQLNMETAPNVTGVVESTNPVVQKVINDVLESNSKMPHDPNYQEDMPDDFSYEKIFIPVEESK